MHITSIMKCAGWLCTAVLTVGIVGCGGGDSAVDLPLRRLDDLGSQAFPAGNYVIRSTSEWQALWAKRLEPMMDPAAQMPTVDFSQDALVGISAGWGACETFGIVRLTRYGDDLVVEWHNVPPPPGAGCAGVLVPKRDLVLVPAGVRGRVEFVQTN